MLTREYAWIDDRIVAVLADANAAEPLLWWVTNDHLGRPVQMTESSQAVVWRAAYRPFGEVISVAGPASLDARFPGQWFQLESGLAYNWHRHYDASIGRYTQADPLGVKAGPSVYGYAGGNPVMGVDPEGLDQLVCYYPSLTGGHVGFGDPNSGFTEGFYPTGSLGRSSPGQVKRDNQQNGQCKVVQSDENQDDCMRKCKAKRKNQPEYYSLKDRQCTSFVRDCMNECRIPAGEYAGPFPSTLFEGIQ